MLYVLSCLTCLVPYVLSYLTCSHVSRKSYLTCSTVNHYKKQPLLRECHYSGRSHQDPLIYVNFIALIHQPAFIRKPRCDVLATCSSNHFYINNFNISYSLKNKGVCVPRPLALGPYPRLPSRRPSAPKILHD